MHRRCRRREASLHRVPLAASAWTSLPPRTGSKWRCEVSHLFPSSMFGGRHSTRTARINLSSLSLFLILQSHSSPHIVSPCSRRKEKTGRDVQRSHRHRCLDHCIAIRGLRGKPGGNPPSSPTGPCLGERERERKRAGLERGAWSVERASCSGGNLVCRYPNDHGSSMGRIRHHLMAVIGRKSGSKLETNGNQAHLGGNQAHILATHRCVPLSPSRRVPILARPFHEAAPIPLCISPQFVPMPRLPGCSRLCSSVVRMSACPLVSLSACLMV
jgi:hypothetical protein